MSERLSCGLEPSTTHAPARRKLARKPTTLGECDIGRVVTVKLVVTGTIAGGVFCRAVDADGRESEPRTLPAEWPLATGGE